MKFAPFHTLLLCLFLCFISCRQGSNNLDEPKTKKNTISDTIPHGYIKKERILKPKSDSIKRPKEQLERAIEKKNKTSFLDSLKPKTA